MQSKKTACYLKNVRVQYMGYFRLSLILLCCNSLLKWAVNHT